MTPARLDRRGIALPSPLLSGFIDTLVHFGWPGGGVDAAKLLTEPLPVRVLKIAAAMRATLEAGVTTVRDLGFLGPSLAALATTGATTGATAAPRLLNAIAMVYATGGHGDLPLPRTIGRPDQHVAGRKTRGRRCR